MNYLIVSQTSQRYIWELETLCYNLIVSRGIAPERIVLLAYGEVSYFDQLVKTFKIQGYFYEDTRPSKWYASSIRPWLIAQYIQQECQGTTSFVYLDSDVIQLKEMDFSVYESNEKVAYASLTPYVSDDFLLSKRNGDVFLAALNELVPLTIEERQLVNTELGGAQWILNQVTSELFNEIYAVCETLYKKWFTLLYGQTWEGDNLIAEPDIWCTDMFVLQRLLVKSGYRIQVLPEMSFVLPEQLIQEEDDYLFLHNAGIEPMKKPYHKYLFWKSAPSWRKMNPYDTDLSYVLDNRYSFIYISEMQKIKQYKQYLISQD